MSFEDTMDELLGNTSSEPPECSYWNDGKHKWYTDETHDHRFSKYSSITLKCKCGATDTNTSFD